MKMRSPLDRGLADRLAAMGSAMMDLALELSNNADPASDANTSMDDQPFLFSAHESSVEELVVSTNGLKRAIRSPMPDPKAVRKIIHRRHLRARYFSTNIFADPAWDMLLDLAAAQEEHSRVSVTSLCLASGVPPTTALRWISVLCEAGLVTRIGDTRDKRRTFVVLTESACNSISKYFASLKGEIADIL